MSPSNLEQARALLERYSEIDSRHVFKLKAEVDPPQNWYEGYIHEVRENVITFSWAPSPFDESDEVWTKEHEIPIQNIDLSTLKW